MTMTDHINAIRDALRAMCHGRDASLDTAVAVRAALNAMNNAEAAIELAADAHISDLRRTLLAAGGAQ